MGTKRRPTSTLALVPKIWGGRTLKMSHDMTFPTMIQACNVFKSCKRKHSIAYGNYSGSAQVGSGRLTCDYKSISVQLQLQLPTGTELGNSAPLPQSFCPPQMFFCSNLNFWSVERFRSKIFFGPIKDFGPKKDFGQKNRFWSEEKLRSEQKFKIEKILVRKNVWFKKNFGSKQFWSKKIFW